MGRINSILITVAVGAFSIVTSAQAQVCAGGYPRSDRDGVLSVESSSLIVLDRIAELAALGTNGVLSTAQRLAIQNEIVALLGELDDLHTRAVPEVSARGRVFLDTIADSTFLNVSGVSITGTSSDEAVTNSRNALDAANIARSRLLTCLHESYDPVEISGTPYSPRCSGGFFEIEWRVPTRRYMDVQDLLKVMQSIVNGTDVIIARANRRALQSDFAFYRGELMLQSETPSGGTPQTRRFVKTVFNPVFLGLSSVTIDGAFEAEAIVNARIAIAAVGEALKRSETCLFRNPGRFFF